MQFSFGDKRFCQIICTNLIHISINEQFFTFNFECLISDENFELIFIQIGGLELVLWIKIFFEKILMCCLLFVETQCLKIGLSQIFKKPRPILLPVLSHFCGSSPKDGLLVFEYLSCKSCSWNCKFYFNGNTPVIYRQKLVTYFRLNWIWLFTKNPSL